MPPKNKYQQQLTPKSTYGLGPDGSTRLEKVVSPGGTEWDHIPEGYKKGTVVVTGPGWRSIVHPTSRRQAVPMVGKGHTAPAVWRLTEKKVVVGGKQRSLYQNSKTGEMRVKRIVERDGEKVAVYFKAKG